LRYKGHVTFKYLVHVCTLALIGASCTTATPSPTPSPAATAAPTPSATPTPRGLPAAGLRADVSSERHWYTVPDRLGSAAVTIRADFAIDPRTGDPRVRLVGGRAVPMTFTAGGPRGFAAVGSLSLDGVTPGEQHAEVVVRDENGFDAVVGSATFIVSQPEYVVWTLDFEGDEASDATMANTAAVADGMHVPMTVLWNPRAWTSAAVSADRAAAMLAWTKDRAAKGDEIGLHLHMWTDFVAAAGVAPHLLPRWAGRGDGYDVPITAYSEDEQRALIGYGLKLMADHGLTGVTSFRAGGDFGDAATVRALAASGITADCTAVAAGTFGSLRLPWTLAPDAQPYVPSKDDANKPGDLPLLEAPTNGGNTYGYTSSSIATFVRADAAMLAKAGEVATQRRGIVIVSHPGTIDGTERAAIETLLHAFDAYRYDQDKGPLRFVTLRQLAQAWR
jgi:hypothetical protein